jgi:hypothetical protein
LHRHDCVENNCRRARRRRAPPLLNGPVDVSGDFRALENFYQRAQFSVRHVFDNDLAAVTPAKALLAETCRPLVA